MGVALAYAKAYRADSQGVIDNAINFEKLALLITERQGEKLDAEFSTQDALLIYRALYAHIGSGIAAILMAHPNDIPDILRDVDSVLSASLKMAYALGKDAKPLTDSFFSGVHSLDE